MRIARRGAIGAGRFQSRTGRRIGATPLIGASLLSPAQSEGELLTIGAGTSTEAGSILTLASPALTDEVQELAEDAGTTAAELGGGDERRTIVVGRFGPDSKVREGTTAEIAVDTRALHFGTS